jgi:hypothetical protein
MQSPQHAESIPEAHDELILRLYGSLLLWALQSRLLLSAKRQTGFSAKKHVRRANARSKIFASLRGTWQRFIKDGQSE